MLREDVLAEATLRFLKLKVSPTRRWRWSLSACPARRVTWKRFWPDREALLYDALRYLSQQVDAWRRQLLLDETLSAEQKLLARYAVLTTCVSNQRYPGCLFIAACTFYPDPQHPIHQLAEQQKQASRWPTLTSC